MRLSACRSLENIGRRLTIRQLKIYKPYNETFHRGSSMTLDDFITRIKADEYIDFQDTMAVIAEYYDYRPTEFYNGIRKPLTNPAGRNEGSCKIFAFAKLHGLTQSETLALFGDYYRKDVLENPEGDDHQNIRHFMQDGWEGVLFKSEALTPKHAD